jgi:hypothetical protein
MRKIKGAKDRKGKIIKFNIMYRRDSSSNRGFREIPNALFRQSIAQNLIKIEKHFKTRFTRDDVGCIAKPVGGGSYGIVFNLENGMVLKITRDKTETANALFFRGAQRRVPYVQQATCKITKIAKMKNSKGQVLGLIEREYVDKVPLNGHLIFYMNTFADMLVNVCFTKNPRERKDFYNLARDALRTIRTLDKNLFKTLNYTWDRGVPQIDMFANNLGKRTHKTGRYTKRGDIVIFDFGQGDQLLDCWKKVTENSTGEIIKARNILKTYDKKVPFI